jgi:hypothetical protein
VFIAQRYLKFFKIIGLGKKQAGFCEIQFPLVRYGTIYCLLAGVLIKNTIFRINTNYKSKNMKTIDNSELHIISTIIIESISTSSIYCFGEKKQTQSFHTPFQDTAKQEEYIHLYLLVFAEETIENATNDIVIK